MVIYDSLNTLMYYSLCPDDLPHFVEIHNTNLEEINGITTSKLVGEYGVCIIRNCNITVNEIKDWLPSLGYYLDFAPVRKDFYNLDSTLAYFPDNEEMIVIHNKSKFDLSIKFQTSTYTLPKIKFTLKDWVDNIWCKVINLDYSFTKCKIKNIIDAKNFDQKNIPKYNPPRFNNTQYLKILPRHPLKTECVFFPISKLDSFKEWSVYDVDENHKFYKTLLTLTDFFRPFDMIIKPNEIIILDQIIADFYFTNTIPDEVYFYSLWYKTQVRKHFNYSL